MSSTNRGYDRHKSDYYVTPVEEISKFWDEFYDINLYNGTISILDPCAGGDDEHDMSYPKVLREKLSYRFFNIKTIDIREDSKADIKANYLQYDLDYNPDMIITNPPFNIAREIIEKALDDVRKNGYVIMLLRLNYFGSKSRFDMWQKQLPKYVYVHHKRMSFTDDGKTDSIEYAHFVWQKGYYPDFSKIKVI